jgi:glycosyltransferase involved in cell wall biosynthesis
VTVNAASGSSRAQDQTPRPAISVVVPTRDRPEMLERCLRSLASAVDQGDEMIVVDSASISCNAETIRELAEKVGAIHVRCERPGASTARNTGWKEASHSIVAYVDDDTWVGDDWADSLAACFSSDPPPDFVTGRIEIPPGQRPRLPIAVKRDRHPVVLDRAARGLLGHSANVAVRRSAMEAVNGFDEALGAGARFKGGEDGDLFDRLLAIGCVGRYEPTALSWHDQWRDLSELARVDFGYGIGEGAQIAKLVRSDTSRAKTVALEYLWRWGLVEAWRALRSNHRFLLLTTTLRLLGLLRGFVSGMATPVEKGHYRCEPRRSRQSSRLVRDDAGVRLSRSPNTDLEKVRSV